MSPKIIGLQKAAQIGFNKGMMAICLDYGTRVAFAGLLEL
jgi:hypothetical protein